MRHMVIIFRDVDTRKITYEIGDLAFGADVPQQGDLVEFSRQTPRMVSHRLFKIDSNNKVKLEIFL